MTRGFMYGHPLVGGLAAAALALCLAVPAAAQQATVITGKVTSADNGEPLGGATVTVANTNFGAVTTADGSYQITLRAGLVTGQQLSLTARAIGHKPVTVVAPVGAGAKPINFALPEDVFRLEEVVVTGTAQATSAKSVSFAVAKVTSDEVPVPGASALVGLEGKVAGLQYVPNSAQPGSDVAIRLRGATSIGGRQDPLYVVDGVITRFGLADIAPEDIERVEVIKGAAASSFYGSDAANGVIQIFTKRGKALAEGTLKVTTRFEGGINQMPARMQFSRSHLYEVNADGSYKFSAVSLAANGDSQYVRIADPSGIADHPYRVDYDSWDAIVKQGQFWTGYVSAAQRRGNTNFNTSFENTRNDGVIYGLGGYTRRNFRLNLDQQFRPNVNGSFSAFYANSTNGRTIEGGGPFFSLMFLDPDVNIRKPDPTNTWGFDCVLPYHETANQANPLCDLVNRKYTEDRNRFTGSGRLQWQIVPWLTSEGNFAFDQEAQNVSNVVPFGFPTPSGTPTKGSIDRQSINNYQYNGNLSLTADWTYGAIHNTTRVVGLLENQQNRYFESYSGTLIVSGVPEFAGADPSTERSSSTDQTIRNRQYLAVSTFTLNDRYILDGLVRRDGSSLFGPDSRWSTYYRISGAWRVNEDLHLPGVDEWKLRASYGTAGLRPQFDAQYEILSVNPGGFSKQTLGNPLLKPARSGELELGTDLAFGNGRFNIEYNYSEKTTKDQLLLVDLPAAAGFKQQWQNTGSLRSRTHELSFGAQLINSRSANLQLNIVGDRARQVITQWDIPERIYGFGQMPAAFFLGQGSDLGAMYGNHFVRNIDELYDDAAKAALSGPGQRWSRDSVMVNEDGYVVRKHAYGTANELPIKYVRPNCTGTDAKGVPCDVVQIGNANPDFNVGFNLSLTVKRLSLFGLLNWQKGGNIYNGTRQWAFQGVRDQVQDQCKPDASGTCTTPQNASTCGTAQADPTLGSCPRKQSPYYGVGFYNGLSPDDFFVEPGSYAKLKEASVAYTLVHDQLRHVGLGAFQELRLSFVGRNLFRFTNYSGLDPEISGLYGDPFQVKMDWFQYPQFRQFSTVVELTF